MAGGSEVIKVKILGTQLQLRGGDNAEAVINACEYVDEQIELLRDRAPTATSLQIALMTAINIADELKRLAADQSGIEAAMKKAHHILEKTGSV